MIWGGGDGVSTDREFVDGAAEELVVVVGVVELALVNVGLGGTGAIVTRGRSGCELAGGGDGEDVSEIVTGVFGKTGFLMGGTGGSGRFVRLSLVRLSESFSLWMLTVSSAFDSP